MKKKIGAYFVDEKFRPTDAIIAGASITSPVWLQSINEYGSALMVIGGVILVYIRIANAWFEWRTQWAKRKEEEKTLGLTKKDFKGCKRSFLKNLFK